MRLKRAMFSALATVITACGPDGMKWAHSDDTGASAFDAAGTGGRDGGVAARDEVTCGGADVCTPDYPCDEETHGCLGQLADWVPTDSPNQFTDTADGTIVDMRSGLMWQQSPSLTLHNWANAKASCQNLSFAGGGWRLPTKAQLESIIDFRRSNLAIDPSVFPSSPTPTSWSPLVASGFWSSSPVAGLPVGAGREAWYVSFADGHSDRTDVSDSLRIRCVR